uniref:Gamma-aminobutyric acid receptor subunit pi n=1 Tax=Mastacembelus armatus TaxID=205130 RepID=A0A7N8XBM4_9TELE
MLRFSLTENVTSQLLLGSVWPFFSFPTSFVFQLYCISACMFPNHHWGEWNDSQLQPTIQRLMKGYNRYLRPNFNEGPVEIGMSLDIASIDAISEINMDYTATIFLRQRWCDSRLVFPGNESVSVDGRLVSLLWIPDTFIPDSKRSFLHDVTVENRLIRIFSNGTVLYALRITATIACNMDLTKYPMDRQVCTLQLESWGYNVQDVVFYWTRGNDSVKGLDTLRLAQYSVERQYPKLVLHFALRRNVLFFILETYVPSILLVVLSWYILLYLTMLFLTMTTLMMGARTSLPNANCFIKAIDVYLGICFTFIFGALLEYACAHFYTMQHQTIEDLRRVSNTFAFKCVMKKLHVYDLLRELNETNGNGSIPIVSSTQPNQSAEVGSTAEQAASLFIVENPHNIDRHARTIFPTAFLFVNILYWLYYLFL